jgi:hypothetical protein
MVKEKFPWKAFPFRLETKDAVCHFVCREHAEKYIKRYKLKKSKYTLEERPSE